MSHETEKTKQAILKVLEDANGPISEAQIATRVNTQVSKGEEIKRNAIAIRALIDILLARGQIEIAKFSLINKNPLYRKK